VLENFYALGNSQLSLENKEAACFHLKQAKKLAYEPAKAALKKYYE